MVWSAINAEIEGNSTPYAVPYNAIITASSANVATEGSMSKETILRPKPIVVGISRPTLSEKAPLGNWRMINIMAKVASNIPT